MFKKLAIASDHAGTALKKELLDYLEQKGYNCFDLGPEHESGISVDYPDYAAKITHMIVEKTADAGLAICGTGIGMSIAANKFSGIRAACPWDNFSCEMSRRHNNTNILCLGSRTFELKDTLSLLNTWLETPFDGDRHQKRLDKITCFEKK